MKGLQLKKHHHYYDAKDETKVAQWCSWPKEGAGLREWTEKEGRP